MATEIKSEAAAVLLGKQLGQSHAKEIDLARILSQGKNGGKSFITEEQNAATATWVIRNETENDIAVVIAPGVIVKEGEDKIPIFDADAVIHDGVIFSTVSGESKKHVTATSLDSGRTIDAFMRYALQCPTRILSASMESRNLDGSPDTGNFTTPFKTVWTSPFHKSEDNYLPLRKFQNNKSNSPQFCDVNFKKEGFPVLISNEHGAVQTIKKETELTITWTIGYQNSLAQYLYRSIKEADQVVPTFSEVGQNCNC